MSPSSQNPATKCLLLGPLVVLENNSYVKFKSSYSQLLLFILSLNSGRSIPIENLIDFLWSHPPVSARNNLSTYVSQLRVLLPETHEVKLDKKIGGYQINWSNLACDFLIYRELVSRSQIDYRQGRLEESLSCLKRAVELWRGKPGEGLPHSHRTQQIVIGLEAMHQRTLQSLVSLAKKCDKVPEIEAIVLDEVLRTGSDMLLSDLMSYSIFEDQENSPAPIKKP